MTSSSFINIGRIGITSPTSARFTIPHTSFSLPSSSSTNPSNPAPTPTRQSFNPQESTSTSWMHLSTISSSTNASSRAGPQSASAVEEARRAREMMVRHWPYHHLTSTFARLTGADPEPHHLATYISNLISRLYPYFANAQHHVAQHTSNPIPRLYPYFANAKVKVARWSEKYPTLFAFGFCAAIGKLGVGLSSLSHTAALFALPGHARALRRLNRGTNRQVVGDKGGRWIKLVDVGLQTFYLPLALVHSPDVLLSLARTAFITVPGTILNALGWSFQSFARAVGDSREMMVLSGRVGVWGRLGPFILAGALMGLAGAAMDYLSARSNNNQGPPGDDSDSTASVSSRGTMNVSSVTESTAGGSTVDGSYLLTTPRLNASAQSWPAATSSSASSSGSMTVIPNQDSTFRSSSSEEDNGGVSAGGVWHDTTPEVRQHMLGVWIDRLALGSGR
ncbi:hypothetical protein A4X13_0g2044 [Tilletia indica]|uniref:Uncharacterized protein n=1 Tax=Tilletia indica TaxID=43049 RepID=A0A177TUW9_9BASI|nr:hypothetical protein A4X13_0g2044 [Tilletia indica]